MTRRFIINGKFLRAESTGVHRVAMELASGLADLQQEGHAAVEGLDFEVWHTKDGSERAKQVRLPTRMIDMLTGNLWEQLTLPLRQGRATLLNLCNIGPFLSRNAVTMIHDAQVHITPESYRRSFRQWYRFVQPALAKRHRRILTVSAFSRAEIAAIGLCPAEKVSVIHNGVDHVFREAADHGVNTRLALEQGRYVVALSTTQAHKNIRLLLEVFARPELSGLTLVLVGGTAREAFEQMGLSVPANVRFAGRVSDAALRALMENALCLAFPSTTEGFGLPPLEAMILGCPAIVAPCGALPEVCGDAALYAAPDDPAAWAKAIVGLADDASQHAALAAAGRHHAESFTWRKAAIALASELQTLHR